MPINQHIRIGTRGSDLALWQANFVKGELEKLGCTVEVKIIKTQGHNDSSSLTLMPPPPLMKLNNMVRQFKTLRSWHDTIPSDFSTLTELYSLFKKSKDYFAGMLQNKF